MLLAKREELNEEHDNFMMIKSNIKEFKTYKLHQKTCSLALGFCKKFSKFMYWTQFRQFV